MSSVNGIPVADRAAAARELLRQRAVALGLLAEAAGAATADGAIETLLDREVRVPEPNEEECRRWYDAHPDEFIAGELAFARHILFAVTPGVPVEPLRRKAEETLRELQQHPAQFAERAAELSNCPSGQQGGALGHIARGECVPEFERVLFGPEEPGILPRLISTRYGFHIVAIDGRVPGHRVPFEAARERIAGRLTEAVWRRALEQYVGVLAGQVRVDGVELGAAASPLVQ
jgi:peptidyl-prolyl cis-trans isomerase C